MTAKYYGLMAEFDSPAAILGAAEKVRAAGFQRWETFTPFPVHGLDKVAGFKNYSSAGLRSCSVVVRLWRPWL